MDSDSDDIFNYHPLPRYKNDQQINSQLGLPSQIISQSQKRKSKLSLSFSQKPSLPTKVRKNEDKTENNVKSNSRKGLIISSDSINKSNNGVEFIATVNKPVLGSDSETPNDIDITHISETTENDFQKSSSKSPMNDDGSAKTSTHKKVDDWLISIPDSTSSKSSESFFSARSSTYKVPQADKECVSSTSSVNLNSQNTVDFHLNQNPIHEDKKTDENPRRSNESNKSKCCLNKEQHDSIEKQVETKTGCLHLHFHVDGSPKKFVQTTLDHYFGKRKVTPPNKITVTSTKNKKPRTAGLNKGATTTKAWNKINKGATTAKAWNNIISVPSSASNTNSASTFSGEGNSSERVKLNCPFYKLVKDTSFSVDAFSYGKIDNVSCYFLSHFHADHYKGLTKKFDQPIYCSEITAKLLMLRLKINAKYINILTMNEPRIIKGVEVTLLEANHCPGAVMFLFYLPTGKTILHVGDFRADENMEEISSLSSRVPLDILYLDTTYLNPSYNFPSQGEVLTACRQIARNHVRTSKKQVRFLIGSYTIGKEKVFREVAKELDCKIYADATKTNALRCIDDAEIKARLTDDKQKAQLHVVSMINLSQRRIFSYLEQFGEGIEWVCIKPTGWSYSDDLSENLSNMKPVVLGGHVYIYGMPYSEHSSFCELERFVKFCKPKQLISTVSYSDVVKRHFAKWKKEYQ